MPTRAELTNDSPDALTKAANAILAQIVGNDVVQDIMTEAYADFYGFPDVPFELMGDKPIEDHEELYYRFCTRVWLRVVDLLMAGEDD